MTEVHLYDFYADWCGPCKAMEPMIDELAEEDNGINVKKIDVDSEEGQALAGQFGVQGLPTLMLLDENENPQKMFNGSTAKSDILETAHSL